MSGFSGRLLRNNLRNVFARGRRFGCEVIVVEMMDEIIKLLVAGLPGMVTAWIGAWRGKQALESKGMTLAAQAGYKVGDRVRTHTLYGGGVYVFNQNNPSTHTANGFEVPDRPGVKLHHIMTVNLSAGVIDHVVNGVGGPADMTNVGAPVYVAEYPAP